MTGRPALALVGFMASGKTTVGALVASRTGSRHRDLDELIEDRAGVTVAELFQREGEPAFRDLEAALLPEVLAPGTVASLGGGTPLRDESWAAIRERALTVWLDVPLPVVLARAGSNARRPLLRGRDEAELRALLESRLPRYRECDHRVDGARSAEAVADEVCRLWRG